MSSTSEQRMILVTGANKGIGFEVVKKLVKESPVNNNIILLGSRDLKRGEDALVRLGSLPNIHVLQLDMSSKESIARATDEIKCNVTKAAVIALTRIEARQCSGTKNVLMLSVCPGFCATDINKNASGARHAKFGADSILYVINAPQCELENGCFYRDGKQLPQIGLINRKN
ncbi:unnamed protein product [Rotaria sp. Silwood2]|nr:unnamed protein product [Rotaria sp. Silwood2]CAF3940138.1 unnamed protein product [Rotaria sp. Silwood2]